MDALTKDEWRALKAALLRVPAKYRDKTWKDGLSLVEAVLHRAVVRGMPPVDIDEMKFAVKCGLCGRTIEVGEDFVFKGASASFVHYDCHFRFSDDRIWKGDETEGIS